MAHHKHSGGGGQGGGLLNSTGGRAFSVPSGAPRP
jgi:hypothetical protein